MKRTLLFSLLLISALFLCACTESTTFEPKESGIFIRRDRHVIGAEVESFDNSSFETPRYSDTELTAFVEDSVRAYNEEKANLPYVRAEELKDIKSEEELVLPVSIQLINVADKVATVMLDYADSANYLAFNGTSEAVDIQNLIVGTVKNGNDSNLTYSNMVKAEDGSDAMAVDIMDLDKYMLVAVEGNTLVTCEGKIFFMTKGMELVDEFTVRTVPGETNYIVFK
ncbi:MAG: hypothetical protein J5865_08505 [Lachnospiraceae bacterium]|nr:hypothetical protein [Lachnospiraceae bacterium]